jgi:zinc protease
MFKGTRRIAPGEFSRTIARNGGDDNAFTSQDYTAYYERIARDRLELVMSMEADRMRNLRFSDETFASERDVIAEERRQRVDNNPGAVMGERMRAMLWPHHPYGTPVIGWLHEINALDRETALEFYRTWYAPNNAILVVAGDVDAAEQRSAQRRPDAAHPQRRESAPTLDVAHLSRDQLRHGRGAPSPRARCRH